MRATAIAAVLVACAAPLVMAARAAAADEPATVRLHGVVKSVEVKPGADPGEPERVALELQERRGTFRVASGLAQLPRYIAKSLAEAAASSGPSSGPTAHVLGKQRASKDPAGRSSAVTTVIQIQSILVGEVPKPELPEELRKQGFEWFTGPLGKLDEKRFTISGYSMQAGPERQAVVVEWGTPAEIARGDVLVVTGERQGDAASREVRATRIVAVSPAIPLAELKVLLGL